MNKELSIESPASMASSLLIVSTPWLGNKLIKIKLDLSIFSRDKIDIRPVLGEPKTTKILESGFVLIFVDIRVEVELSSDPNFDVITLMS